MGLKQVRGIRAVIAVLGRVSRAALNLARLDGPIPRSLSKFPNLRRLYLNHNSFSGSLPRSLSKLVNLHEFDVSNNKLEGEVPAYLWKIMEVSLSHNSFTSVEKYSDVIIQRQSLVSHSNLLRGPFPLWICNLRWLRFLDLSNNLLSGSLPTCLRNLVYLIDLNLRNNTFSGTLPDIISDAPQLQSFDVSRNQLWGKFPKFLINCTALKIVNVESNKIKDKFPSWLEALPSLHVLKLGSNKFYGPLYHGQVSFGFQSLRVIDISHNGFTGTLPPYYFSNWDAMTTITEENDQYMNDFLNSTVYNSMEMVTKGVEMSFERIRYDFRAIDFSGNKIYGNIPESIGLLKELRLLNLSGNAFTSDIPRILANLTKLETLDLSRNKLSGEIPQVLGKLSFLSYMNFSHNLLQGPVPRGTQFQRQKCSSFLDNPGLYGLEEICRETHALNPTSQLPEELSEAEEQMFNWVAAAIAYGPGVYCGLVFGYIYTSHNHDWFTEKFGRKKLVLTSVR
ncbi:PREDICTED: receptor-like protein 12 [Camelina sativa]|uniref:Receptor-like protein 12 n=1 Tax=Camelina sativa TaxID=90675 RepID=A0ABM0WPN5_CAMSA|nr:PREDICTED: receptor-like protein 12 [Camelina sativa]